MKNNFDVIIVGSGIAGLSAALDLPNNLNIALFTKSTLEQSATQLAQGGVAAVVNQSDSVKAHINDTLLAGDYHNDKQAVATLSQESKNAIEWLESIGVSFDKNSSGAFSTHLEAAHSQPRVVHVSDFTGKYIESALIDRVKSRKNIAVFENYFCTDLLISDKTCVGGSFLHHETVNPFYAKNTILATGGAGQLYQWTTNPIVATADGVAIAHRAGVELKDLEFIQFHPTALKKGESPLFLLSEALRGSGAYIVNSEGKRFLFETLEKGELAPRDELSRAIFEKMKRGEVYLDMRHIDKKTIKSQFPNIYTTLKKKYNLDLTRKLIPITPAAHYLCGGVVTDLNGKTSVQNLYAVGEVACTGVHGANRLASNSLLEGVVFGRRVARNIKNKSKSPLASFWRAPTLRRGESRISSIEDSGQARVTKLKTKLQNIMWEKVGIVRTQNGLKEAQKHVQLFQKNLSKINQHNQESLELRNMIETSLLIIKACLARKKSLGAHYIAP